MSAKKRKTDADDDSESSLSSLEDTPVVKKTDSLKLDSKRETSASGDKIIDLTGKKYVCVRQFKGKIFVDIREYYEDKTGGALKPGKKGISLNVEQWGNLKDLIAAIDSDIKDLRP